jgi:hypothetical protein
MSLHGRDALGCVFEADPIEHVWTISPTFAGIGFELVPPSG